MDDVGAVDRLERPKDLIYKVLTNDDQMKFPTKASDTYLAMIISQSLRPNNPVQICLHEFLND